LTEPVRRYLRNVPTPIDPDRFVHIDRPSNFSLRVGAVVIVGLSALAGVALAGCAVALFDPAENIIYLVAAVSAAAVSALIAVRSTLRSGRRIREDFIRCGGDPTGVTVMMFGTMRGQRTAEGNWEVPPQGSGDYV